MTVCIAALFQWNYASVGQSRDHGFAAITASDRMITAVDVEYEREQQKIGYFGNSLVLISGDIAVHSQAIAETEKEIGGRQLAPHDIALIYGRAMQGINRRYAENSILAPLGLNTDTFLAQQNDFSEGFVNKITTQFQEYRPIDAEALIVGSAGGAAHIYSVDAYGNDINLDGVGFGAIGIGAWHAKSRLMQVGHTRFRVFAPTLASVFAAKKNAEIAPGVGAVTDINIVLRDRIFPLWNHLLPEVERLYKKYADEVSKFGDMMVNELQAFVAPNTETDQDSKNAETEGSTGENAQANERAGQATAETARGNEGGEENKSAG